MLKSEMDRRGTVSYWRFYRNRFLRLYPAMLTMLAIFSAVTLTTDLTKDRPKVLRTVLGAVTYTTNVSNDGVSRALNHLWTLALEEQFYVLWPVILVCALRKKVVPATLVLVAVILTAVCGWVIHLHADSVVQVYGLPTSWAITLLIGAAARLSRDRLRRMLTGRRGQIAAIVAFAVVAVITFLPDVKDEPMLYLVGGPLIAVSSVAMALQAEKWSRTPISLTPFRALGLISYAAYLWNYLLVSWLQADGRFEMWDQLWSVILSILAATLSWWLIERPFADYRKRLDARARARVRIR
ncbi:MAG: acyltransferase [Nakamurella sp.]